MVPTFVVVVHVFAIFVSLCCGCFHT